MDRFAGVPVPDQGGLALVGDADGGYLGRLDALGFQHFSCDSHLAAPDLHGIVFHLAWLGVVLGEFLLRDADDAGVLVEQDGPAAGGALIKGENIACWHVPVS